MKKRNLLLTYLITLFVFSNAIPYVSAQQTVVYIDPSSYTVPEVGMSFTINVSITNVTSLYGYELILWYNTILLDGAKVELPPNHVLTPSESNRIFHSTQIDDDFNGTHGLIWVVATLLNPESPKNGSGVLATITFNASKAGGPSPLRLYSPGFVYPVKLSNPDANPIECTAVDGTVEVIQGSPEQPTWMYIGFVIAVTVIIAVAATLVYRKRTKKPF